MPRAPPRWLCPWPGLLHPAGHCCIVTLRRPPHRPLTRPAVPPQQLPHPADRQRHTQPVRNQHPHPRQRPALSRPALSHRSCQQQRLQQREVTVVHLRTLRRTGCLQCLESALTPGTAPPLHRPHTDPKILRDHRVLLTPCKALGSQHAHPFTPGLTLRSETTTLRIPHVHELLQGSTDVTPDNPTERSVGASAATQHATCDMRHGPTRVGWTLFSGGATGAVGARRGRCGSATSRVCAARHGSGWFRQGR